MGLIYIDKPLAKRKQWRERDQRNIFYNYNLAWVRSPEQPPVQCRLPVPETYFHSYTTQAKLLGLCEADAATSKVVNRVPFPEECVSENRERANGFREVHAHKGRDARSLDLEDVIIRT